MFDDLNDRQQKFVTLYIESGNGTQSALRAGYAESSAHVQAHDLLKNPKVQAAIKEKQDEMDKWLRLQFKNAAQKAFKVIQEISDNPEASDRDRFAAAKDLLDRAGHKATDKQEISGAEGGPVVVRFTDPE